MLSLYHFECTTTFDRPLFWEVCPMHSVSVIMHVFSWNLAFFYTVTAVLFIVFCPLVFSISFVATLGLLGYIYILNCLSQVLSNFPDNNGSRGIFVSPVVLLSVSVLFIFASFSSLFSKNASAKTTSNSSYSARRHSIRSPQQESQATKTAS